MKKVIIASIVLTIFLAEQAISCDQQALEKNLIEFCNLTAKLDYSSLTNLQTFPDTNFNLKSCEGSIAFIYTSTPPYTVIRYPYRSYDNQVFQIQGKSDYIERITESSLKTKKANSVSADFGPTELGFKKNFIMLACQPQPKGQPYIVSTFFISSKEKPYLTSALFIAPSTTTEKALYLKAADPETSLPEKNKAIISLYEKTILLSKNELISKIGLSSDAIDSVLANSFIKEKVVEFVLSKLRKNTQQNIYDIQGSIVAHLEKTLVSTQSLGLLIKQHQDQKNLAAESAKVIEANKVLAAQNEALKKSQLSLGEKNNYTYSVLAAGLFFVISVICGFIIYKK